MFAELKRYRDEHGDWSVPRERGENQKLGRWMVTQRVRKKEGTLTREQERRLNTLGFEWHPKKRRTAAE